MCSLERKTCLVTGASRGIGLGIARRLDADGYRLALTASTPQSERKLRHELADFKAFDHVPAVCDVSQLDQLEALFADVDAKLGRLDALVVNAGVHQQGPAIDIPTDEWDRLFAIDVRAAMICCREAAGRMAKQGGGSIVVIGSIAAERPTVQRACYCAAKAAVHVYAQSAALEWAPLGIRVNVVAPGPIDTDFIEEPARLQNGRAELAKLVPLGRLGKTTDVAAAVAYLLGNQADFVTGAVLRVDGGRLWC